MNILRYSYLPIIGLILISFTGQGQKRDIIFVQRADNDSTINQIYNTVNKPLIIIGNSVYQVDSDCITTKFAGFGRESSSGSRSVTIARESADGSKAMTKARESSEGTKRKKDKSSKDNDNDKRGSAEGGVALTKARQSAEGSQAQGKPRESSESNSTFYCEITSSDKLIIYLPAFRKNEPIKIFYHNIFIDKKYYTLKTS